jgi:hypothetical protein
MGIGVARFGGAYPMKIEPRMKMIIGIFASLLNFDQLIRLGFSFLACKKCAHWGVVSHPVRQALP